MIHSLFSQHTFFAADGTEISYDKGKKTKKPPLLFLHGLGGNKDAWEEVRELLESKGWETFAINLRGHGDSGRPRKKGRYNIKWFSSDIAELIKKEEMPRPVVIGHCLGGMVALYLAATMPHILSGLVLVGTGTQLEKGRGLTQQSLVQHLLSFGKTHTTTFYKKGRRDFSHLRGTGDYDIKRILSDILYTAPASYLASLQTMTTFKGSSLLPAVNTPTLLVTGTKDSIFPPVHMQKIKDGVSHAVLRLIPGGNHVLVLNNSQILGTTIDSWLHSQQ